MNTLDELKTEMEERGLDGYFTALSPLAKNAVAITPEPHAEEEIPLGASKLGGLPHLPGDTDWPRNETSGVPLSFVAQVNFAETAPFDSEGKLPKSGMLYFFYDCSMDGMPWGFDPKDAAGFRVIFRADAAPTERRAAPAELLENGDNGILFSPARMVFSSGMELPSPESDLCDALELPGDEEIQDAYWEWLDEQAEDQKCKLLGHSDNIQGGMERECEYVTGGIYCGDGTGYRTAKALGLHKNTGRWSLLMQIDSIDDCGMMWGDVGRLYLWIRNEDLEKRKFENAWLILQCG